MSELVQIVENKTSEFEFELQYHFIVATYLNKRIWAPWEQIRVWIYLLNPHVGNC